MNLHIPAIPGCYHKYNIKCTHEIDLIAILI